MKVIFIFPILGLLGSLVTGGLANHTPFGVVRPHAKSSGRTTTARIQQKLDGDQGKSTTTFQPHHPSASSSPLGVRGGGCSDSDPVLFLKLCVSGVCEAGIMLGLLLSSISLSDRYPSLPSIFGLPLLELLASFAIVFVSSFFGSIVDGGLSAASNQVLSPSIVPGNPNWYAKLAKPWWNPPGWVFPLMWLVVSKPSQLCALSRVLKFGVTKAADGSGTATVPLIPLAVYCSHLALGDAWNKVFFGLQCTGRGAAVITVFYGMLLASGYLFSTLDEVAGYYMLPTCAWVTVATALNWNIYLKNKK
jgi:translocator protein